MKVLLIILVIPVAIVVGLLSRSWRNRRSHELIHKWAAENGYQVVSSSRCGYSCGPFTWSRGRAQTVYAVTIRDKAGELRSAWIRCGSTWKGLRSDEVTVGWTGNYPGKF